MFGTPTASCAPMRNPLLLTSALTCLALSACGGSNESAKSANDSADKANEAAEKAEDRADKAEDRANDAASDADKAEKENNAK